MGNFSHWWQSYLKDPTPRQINWLCGTEPVLIEEIVSAIKKELNPDPWNFSAYVAGEDSEREIWADVNQYPMGDSPRLVIIRNAEKLGDTERIRSFVRTRAENPRTHLIFVSNEPGIRKTVPTEEERKTGAKPETVDFLGSIGARGFVVECRPFTQTTAKHATSWVKSKITVRDGVAAHLLNRSNGELRIVRDVCTKLAVFPNDITLTTINQMMAERPQDTFSDALLSMNKKVAISALAETQTDDYSRIIGLLDSRLDLAGLVHDMLLEHHTPAEIQRAAGSQGFLVPQVLKVSRYYDQKRRLQIRKLLAVADEVIRVGYFTGVLEAVAVYW